LIFSVRGVVGDIITNTKVVVSLFRGFGVLTPQNLAISIRLAGRSYNSVCTTVLHCDCHTRSSAVAEGPRDALVSIETRVPGLSCGIICVILRLAVFIQYWSMTDRHINTDRQTDGQTHDDGMYLWL